MCYEERFFTRPARKKERQRVEPAARGEGPTPKVQPDRPKPEIEKPRQPERELEEIV